ncbi:MAG: hypothetical protein HeimC3_12210 [Candidatus Heimdallarchaeota archaeon LC_3]|nr:MAG: hypothetical protein HeimC3_12210 [Candidatus Heimdallarchaeota archaeon LC_3]
MLQTKYNYFDQYNFNGERCFCHGESTDRPISNDWSPERGSLLTPDPDWHSEYFSKWTNNGGSVILVSYMVALTTGVNNSKNTDNNYEISRNRFYNVSLNQDLAFSTQLFSQPERLLNYYNEFDLVVISTN